MILDTWVEDAGHLVSGLPNGLAEADRSNYLLHELAPHGAEIIEYLSDGTDTSFTHYYNPSAETTFFVIRKALLAEVPTRLGKMARDLRGIALVAHSPKLPTILALPDYDKQTPIGNGLLLLHELEHVDQGNEDSTRSKDFTVEQKGRNERDAYALNTGILRAHDGSDFEGYIEGWPATFSTEDAEGEPMARIAFHDDECPAPPKETIAYEMWEEDGNSRLLLQSIGRITILEKLAVALPPIEVDRLVGNLHPAA